MALLLAALLAFAVGAFATEDPPDGFEEGAWRRATLGAGSIASSDVLGVC